MFTGSPLGHVNLVSPFSSLDSYKIAAFLGWNTMTDEIYGNLKNFVQEGGILFICGCHFDTRDNMDASPSILKNGKISELTGLEISGPGPEIFSGIRACLLKNVSAEKTAEHFFVNKYGKGKVYFGNFYDYPHDRRLVCDIQNLLKKIAEETNKFGDIELLCENPSVLNFNVWKDGTARSVYVSNIEWDSPDRKTSFEIKHKGKTVRANLKGGESACIRL